MNYIELLKDFGEYNNWHGFVDMYFTKKQMSELKKMFGITNNDTIKSAYSKAIA